MSTMNKLTKNAAASLCAVDASELQTVTGGGMGGWGNTPGGYVGPSGIASINPANLHLTPVNQDLPNIIEHALQLTPSPRPVPPR